MELALEQARKAFEANEVPIGAVIVVDDQVVAAGHNSIEADTDATSHAEIKIIKESSNKLNRWRLSDATIYVTVEPCTMCLGAIKQARIQNIVFGCYDQKFGALGSLYDLRTAKMKVVSEVLATESRELLQSFFKRLR